jgi:hypothetical protein
MSETQLSIELLQGNFAPRYSKEVSERKLDCKKVVITENGMVSGLPLVDFQLVDKDGNEYFFAITGRLVNMISAAIRGVNMRNHGCEEP